MLRVLTTILVLLILAVPAPAQVYRQENPDGTVTYSDRPPSSDAAPVDLEPLNTISPGPIPELPSSRRSSSGRSQTQGRPQSRRNAPSRDYQLSITSPAQDGTIRSNTGRVPVKVQVQPPPDDPGYGLKLYLDGQAQVQGASLGGAALTGVTRGTHTVQAELLDPSGKAVARSGQVTFHVHQHSVLHR